MSPLRALVLALSVLGAGTAAAELRSYDVDPEYRQEVLAALDSVLTANAPPDSAIYGRVSLLPTGQLLVDAAAQKQAEIASLIESIARQAPGETPTVTLRYWALWGVPGGADTGQIPPVLGDVVRELEANHGDLGLSVIDSAALSSRGGHAGGFESETWEIEQVAYPNGDRLNAFIGIGHRYQEIEVEIAIARGEFIVLSEGTTLDENDTRGILTFVVHWPE